MDAPPVFDGVVHLSVAVPAVVPAAALRLLGALGVVAGLALLLACVPPPLEFTARTLKLYDLPFVKFLKVWLLLLAPSLVHVLPPLLDT
jgi:hypothetical protein